MSSSISRKILILVAVPVLCEVVLVGVLTTLVKKVEAARVSEAHARELGTHLNNMVGLHMRRVSLLLLGRAYTSLALLKESDASREKMRQERDVIRSLVASNPEEQATWNTITDLVVRIDQRFLDAKHDFENGNKLLAAMKWSSVQHDLDHMLEMTQKLSAEQERLRQEHSAELEQYDKQLQNVIHLSLLGSVLIAFGLATFFNKGTTDRLEVLMQNTASLAMGRPPVKSLSGSDELAQIDKLYHRMYEDLTVLRHKERAIFDSAAEIICSIDQSATFTDVNDAATKMWGYAHDELLGRRVVDIIHDSDKHNTITKLQDAMAGSEVRFETRVTKRDGTATDTAWSVTWSGVERSLYCVIHDISERKQLEEMKRHFVDMISHDLRTPLASVLASLQLISLPTFRLSEEGQSHLARGERNLLRALNLINQLMDLEKFAQGTITLFTETTYSSRIIDSAVGSISDLAAGKNIKIDSIGTDVEMVADAERLVQVMINLLGNALKFSPSNSTITVAVESQGSIVRFNVSDQGRGIPAELKDKVFERFQQVDPSDKVERAGTGLGLAICKSIVEAHNGKIGVESELGRGSTFWFELPVGIPTSGNVDAVTSGAENDAPVARGLAISTES